MNTLIFNGSPRPHGDSAALIAQLRAHLQGDVFELRAYDCGISPCVDCRFCWENEGCAIHDGMQEVYARIQQADNILIVSPIYFAELTGPLLGVLSRLQTNWCQEHFRGKPAPKGKKQGGVVLVGGGDGSAQRALASANTLLRIMHADPVHFVLSHNTNHTPAKDDRRAMEEIKAMATKLNDAKRTVSPCETH